MIIEKDLLTIETAADDVVNCPGGIYASLAWHVSNFALVLRIGKV